MHCNREALTHLSAHYPKYVDEICSCETIDVLILPLLVLTMHLHALPYQGKCKNIFFYSSSFFLLSSAHFIYELANETAISLAADASLIISIQHQAAHGINGIVPLCMCVILTCLHKMPHLTDNDNI